MKRIILPVSWLVALVGVAFGCYEFAQYQAKYRNQKEPDRCLDVAKSDYETANKSLDYLGVSNGETRRKAERDYDRAVQQCQISYPVGKTIAGNGADPTAWKTPVG
jgi:hypothetical protein